MTLCKASWCIAPCNAAGGLLFGEPIFWLWKGEGAWLSIEKTNTDKASKSKEANQRVPIEMGTVWVRSFRPPRKGNKNLTCFLTYVTCVKRIHQQSTNWYPKVVQYICIPIGFIKEQICFGNLVIFLYHWIERLNFDLEWWRASDTACLPVKK